MVMSGSIPLCATMVKNGADQMDREQLRVLNNLSTTAEELANKVNEESKTIATACFTMEEAAKAIAFSLSRQ